MWQLAVKAQPEGKGNKGKQEGEEEEKETYLGNNSFWPFLIEHCRGSFRQQVMESIVTAFTIYRCAETGTVFLLTYH